MNRTATDSFGSSHPVITFTYFMVMVIFSMIFLHPLWMILSFGGAFLYSLFLKGSKALVFFAGFVLPVMVVSSLINPLFNHQGMTILFYFRDNPITAESIAYGMATGLMFGCILLWFSCYNAVITSDKLIHLFGKLMPGLSLIFAMILRFIPKFRAQIRVIAGGQKAIGRFGEKAGLLQRIKSGMKILSIMVTWALENGIDTADSMKARGYGLPGRSSYALYRFDSRDRNRALVLGLLLILVGAAGFQGAGAMNYFPFLQIPLLGGFGIAGTIAYGAFCLAPLLMGLAESWKWKRLEGNDPGETTDRNGTRKEGNAFGQAAR